MCIKSAKPEKQPQSIKPPPIFATYIPLASVLLASAKPTFIHQITPENKLPLLQGPVVCVSFQLNIRLV